MPVKKTAAKRQKPAPKKAAKRVAKKVAKKAPKKKTRKHSSAAKAHKPAEQSSTPPATSPIGLDPSQVIFPAHSVRTPEVAQKFLETLGYSGNVSLACQAAGVSRNSMYLWKHDDENFSAKWDALVVAAGELLEEEAVRRAVDGIEEPKFYEGAVCGQVRKYDNRLLTFLLTAHVPEKYGKVVKGRSAIQDTPKGNGLEIVFTSLIDAKES